LARGDNRDSNIVKSWYSNFAQTFSALSGQPIAFAAAAILIVGWLVTGPLFGFSDTWQLVMNTVSSIVTFLMVFVIQNTQNRQTEALQIKLDEIIRATSGAHDTLLDLEELEDEELGAVRERYVSMAREARRKHAQKPERAKQDR
jgi:low affinity Fe/Cu permease